MMMRSEAMKKPDFYAGGLVLAVIVLFALMIGTVYKINTQKEAESLGQGSTIQKKQGFLVPPYKRDRALYIITSRDTAQLYMKNGVSVDMYTQKIKKFTAFLEEMGYSTKTLSINDLSRLKKGDVAFILDAQVLTSKNQSDIYAFVQGGGNLFFNFLAGFSDKQGNYMAEKFVNHITGLQLSEKGFGTFKEGLSATAKMLSPLSEYVDGGKLFPLALYDKLPIYKTSTQEADLYASNYDQVGPPTTKDQHAHFKNDEAAMLWHGYFGKGKWIYTSLPSYAFYDIEKSRERYKKMLAGMVDYLQEDMMVSKYPYIDQASAVFVSEDTEYKFTNFQRFADLAKEYHVPVTAFIVANLANLPEHKAMMARIKKNPFVEFASHSTTHKKIVGESEAFIINETANSKKLIDPFAPRPITGFRPPREELNALMKKHLASSGFTYVLGAADSYLYPLPDKEYPRLIYIPRHGTDDYSYLVNLDWDQKEIGNQIERESQFVTKLNGIYTLSVHTHLFSYSSNIDIIRSFFKYLKKHPELKPLMGKDIIQRVLLASHLKVKSQQKGNQLIVSIDNSNAELVKNLHIKLFKNPSLKIKKGAASKGSHVRLFEKEDAIIIDKIPAKSSVVVYLSF